jgi:DNA-binding beta-propeller fold protein YncE
MRPWALAVLVAAGCGPEPAPPCAGVGVICPLAGTGDAAFNGDGRPPTETALYLPTTVRPAPDGLVHVMDFNNMRLRRIDGLMQTVVGSGLHQIATPGAHALDSGLENPIDFAFAPDGRLVLVSIHDPRVLALADDGTLEVLAGSDVLGDDGDGGPALEATFTELEALAIGADGTIFLSDGLSNRVRAVRPDGTVQACAGSGVEGYAGDGGPAALAALYHPQGLTLDDGGNLYIADTYNHVIRRVDRDGVIETIAGTGAAGLSGDGGPATQAELQFPGGVHVAPDGTLYVADTFNHRVRHIDAAGVITTVAGTAEGYDGDGGPATLARLRGPYAVHAGDDALYVADTLNHVARVIQLR